jgi:hypothetical protein
VLLEPVVMGGEDDATRFAAICGTQRVYANFFRIALNDSDGFIPREAERLARLGHSNESRAMLAFSEAVHRAALDSVQVASADFGAVERWASLLVRRGHWAYDAIPPAGEERARYLGMLAWYGVAPPSPEADRVWVGPRLLVRESETEGFVADEIPATGVGCPIAWRAPLREEKTSTNAMASAWFSDHPEFTALAALAGRWAGAAVRAGQEAVARSSAPPGTRDASSTPARDADRPATITAGFTSRIAVAPAATKPTDSTRTSPVTHSGHSLAAPASADSGAGMPALGERWDVGIRDPNDPTPCFARLLGAPRRAIATHGAYVQFVVTDEEPSSRGTKAPTEPRAEGLVSVTVVAPNAATADSSSAALLTLGTADAKRLARERADLFAILIERGADGIDTIWVESDLKDSFALENECGARLRVEYY